MSQREGEPFSPDEAFHHADSGEPTPPIALPPELAKYLRSQKYACLHETSSRGTLFVFKAPAVEIASVSGRIPIEVRHELYSAGTAPVVRSLFRFHDQPESPLAFETFYNVSDPAQRSNFAQLADQEWLHLLFYDESLTHRLSKQVPHVAREGVPEIYRVAMWLRGRLPTDSVDFETAKAEVMRIARL